MKKYLVLLMLAAIVCCTGFTFGSSSGGKRVNVTVDELTAKGAWSSATAYVTNDVVTHSGHTWLAIQNSTNQTPGDSSLYWLKFIAKGDTGSTGARGATWYTGFDTPAGAGVTGSDNDLFFDTSVESKVFKKVSGTWTQLGSIKGTTGAAGQDGQDGAGVEAGANGEHFIDVGNTIAFTGTPSLGKCQYSTSLSPAGFYCYDGDDWVLQGGGGGGTWGSITGTLSDQTDLQAALDAITAGGINITTATPSTPGSANLNDTTHVLSIASTTGVTTFTGSFTAWDTTPTAFSFTDQTDVETSATITSDAITVAGINYPAAISVTGGTYDINASGSFTSSSGTVAVGDTVRARHTSSASNETAVDTVVTIGGVSDTFTSTTVASAGPTKVAYDNFTGTDGTLLSAHTSDSGHTWALSGTSTISIISNAIHANSTENPGLYYSSYAPSSADYAVYGTITVASSGHVSIGPAGRISTSAETGYFVRYGGGNWILTKTVNGTRTQIGSYTGDVPLSATICTLDMVGSTIRVLIGGVERISVTDTSISATGRPGVAAYYSDTAAGRILDTWEVWE